MNRVIDIENLHKNYGKYRALKGINLHIEPGIFGLLGPNGAGKSTLIKILLGLLKPDQGRVSVLGFDSYSRSLSVHRNLGYLEEDQRFYDYMRGKEYLEFIGFLKGLSRDDVNSKGTDLLERLGLSESEKKKIKEYSQGMKQRLGIAQALIGDPKIVILDEPTSNLDPIGRSDFLELIKDVRRKDTTIILSSHVLGEVEQVCDSLVLLNKGKIAYEGEWSDLRKAYPGNSLQDIFVKIVKAEINV